ncbi:MAG TPA: M14 family zinc carboxypeptidase [bacterium]|nr:M14 family zinc carboxypeptidase [bacterium]
MGSCDLSNIIPIVKKDNSSWKRIERTYQFHPLKDGRYQVSWILNNPGKINDIALCYPYGMAEIEKLVKETRGYLKKDIVGLSSENQSIIRLSNDYSDAGSKKAGIYIVARQHSGETPGSWVLEGILRYLAVSRVKNIIVWAIPLSNIDGVEKGCYGKDHFPHDLNRSWGNQPLRHETLVIQRDIARWQERCTPILGLDLHAPGGAEGDGIYFPFHNGQSPVIKKEKYWINVIGRAIGKEYVFSQYKKICKPVGNLKNLTGLMLDTYFRMCLKIPGLCLEIPYGISKGKVLTIEDYLEIGKRITYGIMEAIK